MAEPAITRVPMRFPDAPLLWTVDDVFSPAECARIVEDIERWSPSLATNNPTYRDQDRVIRDDAATASTVSSVMRVGLGRYQWSVCGANRCPGR